MLERERHRLILKIAEERAVVSVIDLCELLGASEATIRRDIVAMSDRDEVRRVRGGVEALNPRFQPHLVGVPLALSQDVQVGEKQAIAQLAAGLIEPGDSIIIGGGSTTFCLAKFLENAELDIMTNSFPLAAQLVNHTRNRVTLPGGTIYREQSIVLSPFECDVTDHFWGAKLFTSCFGLNRFGMMENDPLIVQSQNKLLARAEQVILLADSTKLRKQSSMIVIPLSRITTIVTDSGARTEELEPLRAASITVIVARAEDTHPVAAVA
ncbi:DeoR/GlpR transcriptional regulator [Lichenicola cladoniae]|uniref:DeoR/GlpR transcriptional regulator n=1 Tax=Lichenicola cladoniae TaxID=1484109 RepID=A0A6M8HTN3_9PROT|nr:DeoR/GlpR family DNA-binding transcription regulator [Lichenicola cladoniae]NPD67781.1 DeoR/GlpR transcriptional regulator [Acetobacteraceae bacterium]QKE91702.1 DeoR/GlpR transcriptional regulator [Lichenicola cladoniae]